MDELKDVTAEPSSALSEAIVSSPEALSEEKQGTPETGSPQQPVSQKDNEEQQVKEQAVPYWRFKDINDEKNWFKEKYEEQFRMNLQGRQQAQQQPLVDPYANLNPEEERFQRVLDQRIEKIAEMKAESKVREILPIIDAGRAEIARMKAKEFFSEHPDVKRGSPEEKAIAGYVAEGYQMDDAYKVVMFEKKKGEYERQESISSKQKMEAKKQANVENHSIPQGAGAPVKRKTNFTRDELMNMYDRFERESSAAS